MTKPKILCPICGNDITKFSNEHFAQRGGLATKKTHGREHFKRIGSVGGKSKKHKHKTFEIITEYYPDEPAKVAIVKCNDCGEVNKKLMELMQQREDAAFKLYGNKSPYVSTQGIRVVSEKALIDAEDPRLRT